MREELQIEVAKLFEAEHQEGEHLRRGRGFDPQAP